MTDHPPLTERELDEIESSAAKFGLSRGMSARLIAEVRRLRTKNRNINRSRRALIKSVSVFVDLAARVTDEMLKIADPHTVLIDDDDMHDLAALLRDLRAAEE